MPTPAGRGSRATRQGAAVTSALESAADFVTAQDLYARLRAGGERVGLTTVYRHLQRLVDNGDVDTLRAPSGELTYRRCGDQRHHHHLVCRQCGRTVEVNDTRLETWLNRVAAGAGFTDLTHSLEISGQCHQCARPPRR